MSLGFFLAKFCFIFFLSGGGGAFIFHFAGYFCFFFYFLAFSPQALKPLLNFVFSHSIKKKQGGEGLEVKIFQLLEGFFEVKKKKKK